MSPAPFTVRAVAPADSSFWRSLRRMLWPHASADEHVRETVRLLAEPHRYAVFLAVSSEGEALGFAEAAVRHDYVNGCDTSPVLFLEGVYVVSDARRQGIARALCKSIERWGTEHACAEFASDSQIDNVGAQALHRALGFEETERVVFFRKRSLRRAS
jgi:aminoglycoside 6'-N-acetyltransferase I